jgi:hypothetical protein
MYCLTLCTSSFKNVVFFLVSSDKWMHALNIYLIYEYDFFQRESVH